MILVFGGTTEGRKAIETLEEAGSPYYYSTKTGEQEVTLHHGIRVDGAMDGERMRAFCREHGIRLLVDAAHPFAEVLHATAAEVASELGIPAIRFERIFPDRDTDIVWLDGYDDAVERIKERSLLATTGVQSIGRLKALEAKGVHVIYRILRRESSVRLAHEQGAEDGQLCFYPEVCEAEAILMKESGSSGGFIEKVELARRMGMKMYALKRPETPSVYMKVDGEHGLRRMVERLLPEFYPLKSGLTTGTCATAAAIAETRRVLYGEQPEEVPVVLPNGETIWVKVGYGDGYAYCVKEAGDDPDVTDGVEVRAAVSRKEEGQGEPADTNISGEDELKICGGEGVGVFTLPGFDYAPGEAAINRGPREMMRRNIREGVCVTISVPRGEEIARRTFNPRLGIKGGISIIGVSGIVKPFSEEAFVESIRKCMQVAAAAGTGRVVLHSGMKSEKYLREAFPELPQQCFVEYGNAVGKAIELAGQVGIGSVTLGIMMGKAVKLAAGHLDTHSKKQTMDREFIADILREAGCEREVIERVRTITLARELWQVVPEYSIGEVARIVIEHCLVYCEPLFPNGNLSVILLDDEGKIYTL